MSYENELLSDFTVVKKTESFCEETTTAFSQEILPDIIAKGMKTIFHGTLGAGKSFFIRAVLRGLSVTGPIPSPSFTLVNEYNVPFEKGNLKVNHMDLYRLEDEESLTDTGIMEMLYDDSAVLAEWGLNFRTLREVAGQAVFIEIGNSGQRIITLYKKQ